VEKAGRDQDITRDIRWELRKDRRFDTVSVACVEGVVTLEGRVDTKQAESDAVQVAISQARGSHVVTKIEIRPR
jgi:osmotically-inducible protein OsmY